MAKQRSMVLTCTLLVALAMVGRECYVEARLVEWRVPLTSAPTNLSGNSAGELFQLPVETSEDRGDDGLRNLTPMNLSGNVAGPMNLSGNSAGELFELEGDTSDSNSLRSNIAPMNLSGNVVNPMNLSGNVINPMNLSGNSASPMNLSGNSAGKLFDAPVENTPSPSNGWRLKSLDSGPSFDIVSNMPRGHVIQVQCINDNIPSKPYLVDKSISPGEVYHWEVPKSDPDNTQVKYRFSLVWKGTYPEKHVDKEVWEDQKNHNLMPYSCSDCYFNLYEDGLYLYNPNVQHFVKQQDWEYFS